MPSEPVMELDDGQKEQKEIAEMVLFLINRDGMTSVPALKSRVEKVLEIQPMTITAFTKIIDHLARSSLISIDGIIEQIGESQKPREQRLAWVTRAVFFDAETSVYRYTNENLNDMNKKLGNINYRLAWVYKILSQRHQGVKGGVMKRKNKRIEIQRVTIDIPQVVVDRIVKSVKENAVVTGQGEPVIVLDASG